MQVLLIAGGAVRQVQRTDSLSVQKNADGTYNYDGGHFGVERAQQDQVMLQPDEVEIMVGDPVQEAWYALEMSLDSFLAPTPEMALADALGLVMRGSIAAGAISDDEILRVATTIQHRYWHAGITVHDGDVYSHDGALWRCVQGHTTLAEWPPDKVLALWRKIEATQDGPRIWTDSMDYVVDDLVFYPDLEGRMYRCITAHTSQHGWEPPNVPALWTAYQG